MKYLGIVAILAMLASPAMAVYVMHDLDAYTVGQPLSQASGAFINGDDTTGVLDIIADPTGSGRGNVCQVTGAASTGRKDARTGNGGAGNVTRLNGMLYSGMDVYMPDPAVGAGNNVWDFSLLRGTLAIVTHLIGSPTGGYPRDPYIESGGSAFAFTPGWNSLVVENYCNADGTDAYVNVYVNGNLTNHITPSTAGYGIWPDQASNPGAKAQVLQLAGTPREDGGDLLIDNIWGGNELVPEPATLGLLLLGLPFLRRRR